MFVLCDCFYLRDSIFQMKNNLVSSPFHPPLSCLQVAVLIYVCVFHFVTFFFASSLLFSSVLFCSIVAGVLFFSLCVCGRASFCWHSCCDFVFAHSLPLLGYIKPSGEPVVPRSPQLSALSLHSSSCFSPAFPWCRPNPLAANGKPECHGHLSKRQLRHRSRGGRLRQPVPHSAVLPIHRVALQQIWPCPPPWGRPGPVSISGQHSEGPKVRHFYSESALACWWNPLFCSLFHFHWTYWGPDSPN